MRVAASFASKQPWPSRGSSPKSPGARRAPAAWLLTLLTARLCAGVLLAASQGGCLLHPTQVFQNRIFAFQPRDVPALSCSIPVLEHTLVWYPTQSLGLWPEPPGAL